MEPVAVPMYFANWLRLTYSEKKSLSQMSGVKPGLLGVTFMSAICRAPFYIEGWLRIAVIYSRLLFGNARMEPGGGMTPDYARWRRNARY
jgi:hypothetical protein